jgi:hypothetical protein
LENDPNYLNFGPSSSGLLVAVDNSPGRLEVAEINPKPDGAAASRLVADIQRGPVSATSPGLPGRAAALPN